MEYFKRISKEYEDLQKILKQIVIIMTKKIIPYSRQTISSSDVKSVSKILKLNFLPLDQQ